MYWCTASDMPKTKTTETGIKSICFRNKNQIAGKNRQGRLSTDLDSYTLRLDSF